MGVLDVLLSVWLSEELHVQCIMTYRDSTQGSLFTCISEPVENCVLTICLLRDLSPIAGMFTRAYNETVAVIQLYI